MGKASIKKLVKHMVLLVYRCMARVLPVRRRVIVFQSSLGRDCTGNPRAVYEEMVRRGLDESYRCYYILDAPEKFKGQLPGRIRLVKNARLRYYAVMAVAGVWVSDTRFQNYMIKRRDTLYIQTWHGTPLKKLALDMDSLHMAGEESLAQYKEAFRQNTATWDCLISQNPFSSGVFRRAFDFHGTMLECGYPRNDCLTKAMSADERQSRIAELGLPQDKKIMLYAPTWRDNAYHNKESYRFETKLDFARMREAFGDEYVLAVKFHYMVKEPDGWNPCPEFVRVLKEDVDIARVYPVAELLITDYSSVMFDYSLTGRPMFFYAYDLEEYRDTLRGFYFDFEQEAPGPIVTTTEELIAAIQNGLPAAREYEDKYRRFCEKYNPYDDGHASEKVIEIIRKHAESSKQGKSGQNVDCVSAGDADNIAVTKRRCAENAADTHYEEESSNEHEITVCDKGTD